MTRLSRTSIVLAVISAFGVSASTASAGWAGSVYKRSECTYDGTSNLLTLNACAKRWAIWVRRVRISSGSLQCPHRLPRLVISRVAGWVRGWVLRKGWACYQ